MTDQTKYSTDIGVLNAAIQKKFNAEMDQVGLCGCYDRYFYKPTTSVRWSDFARLAACHGAIAIQIPGEDRLVLDIPFITPSSTQPDECEFIEEMEVAELKGVLPVGFGYDCDTLAIYDMAQLGNILVSCDKYTFLENLFVASSVLNKSKLMFIGTDDSNYITAYDLCENRVGDITDNVADTVRAIYDLDGYIKYRAEHKDDTNIVVLIDNIAQIIQADKNIVNVLRSILQHAADAGVYIVCFDRDYGKKISPELRASFTTKIVFKMPTSAISKKALGESGAQLLGPDDMLMIVGGLPLVHLMMPSM
ncbi:MAG: hypothetical protein K2M34_03865 [Alphaproteobacteria bacterium]|nr:hypothetical protein [Alphaproteobacteria bacterium]